MAVKIQLRRDLAANWQSVNPILSIGEPGIEIDTGQVKIGNGVDNWNSLQYSLNIERLENVDGGTPSSVYVSQQSISGGTP